MKRIIRGCVQQFAFLAAAALMVACSSGPRVITNSDPQANFAEFRTFGFMRPLSTDRSGAQSIMSSHLITATSNELEMAGMRRVEHDPNPGRRFRACTNRTTPKTMRQTTPTNSPCQ